MVEAPAADALEDGDADDDALTPLEKRLKKVRRAKRGVRSEISVSRGDWTRHGYANAPDLLNDDVHDTLPRVDARHVTVEEFVAEFEMKRRPCIITHAMDGWPAAQRGGPRQWTWQKLRERFKDHKFKVGSDDDGYAVRLKMSYFCDYVEDAGASGAAADDSPLYVFDGTFGDRDSSKALLDDYCTPAYFRRDDLFRLVGNKRRPPYRWVVFGPARSGSALHIDPLASAAWNALLQGTKRWCLLPPGVPRAACKPAGAGLDGEAITWFLRALPLCCAADWPYARPVHAIQRAGEIMFVPHGWWHAVLNLEHTLAVTQNYISGANFEAAWNHTRKARPRLASIWLERLRAARPELASIADRLTEENAPVSESSPSSSSSSSSSSSDDDDDEDDEEERGSRFDTVRAPNAPMLASTPGSKRALAEDACAATTMGTGHADIERGASWRRRKSEQST